MDGGMSIPTAVFQHSEKLDFAQDSRSVRYVVENIRDLFDGDFDAYTTQERPTEAMEVGRYR